jgi:hypothetical protein
MHRNYAFETHYLNENRILRRPVLLFMEFFLRSVKYSCAVFSFLELAPVFFGDFFGCMILLYTMYV